MNKMNIGTKKFIKIEISLTYLKKKLILNNIQEKILKKVIKNIHLNDHSSNKNLKSLGQEIRKSVAIKHLEYQ